MADHADIVASTMSFRAREVTARELVTRSLERIGEHEGTLNAWVHRADDRALAEADRLDSRLARGEPMGPLAGVPFGVKDLDDAEGMPTRKGSRWYADAGPSGHDDVHVERLRRAGAIAIGKTAVPEFGWAAQTSSSLHGITRNPWDQTTTPGGSSGGSAAAVSAGDVAFATASDGGGSIRTPASFTGLPGIRPSYGRVPSLGATHVAQNATNFALATTVHDTALLLDLCAGPDARDRTCLPAPATRYVDSIERLDVERLRVGVTMCFGLTTIHPEVERLVRDGATRLIDAAGLREVELDMSLDAFFDVYRHLEGVDRFVGVDPVLWTDRLDELDPHVAPGWRSARGVTLPKAARVEEARREVVRRVASWFDDVDVVFTPTASIPAFAADVPYPTTIDGTEVAPFLCTAQTMLPSIVNLPAMSVPVGSTERGLPVGLQLVGPRFREDLLLRLARISELANPWPRHAPI